MEIFSLPFNLYLPRGIINFYLKQNIYIRRLFAACFTLIFAFSITPTKVLHSIFADHKDDHAKNTRPSNTPVLSVSVFNCQCDNLVVESPFTLQLQPVLANIPELSFINNPTSDTIFYTITDFYFELRGPPSVV